MDLRNQFSAYYVNIMHLLQIVLDVENVTLKIFFFVKKQQGQIVLRLELEVHLR